jgi:hypothetical protein
LIIAAVLVVATKIIKGTTSISLRVARATITKGESIELLDSLTPPLPSIKVAIAYIKPSETLVKNLYLTKYLCF